MEVATGGDRWLGGDNLDQKLQEIIESKVSLQYEIDNLQSLIENLSDRNRYRFDAQMRYQTEEAKIQLSSTNNVHIFIDNLLEDENGEIIDVDVTISRSEFENAIRPLIQRSIDLIEELLKEIGYDIDMIDNILLVGGTSCIPLVKEMLTNKYGFDKIKVSEKPMLIVSEGAGILSHRLDDEYETIVGETAVIEDISYTTSQNYFIEVENDGIRDFELIIEKQTTLPTSKSKIYKTLTANQKIAKVAIYAEVENKEKSLQCLGYYPIEENLPIATELVFDIELDLDHVFAVSVYPKLSKSAPKSVILGRGYADQKALNEIEVLVQKAVKEYKTIEGEEELIKFITKQIAEINKTGEQNIDDNKWHELYYKTTEKFEEIKNNEVGRSHTDRQLYYAKRLIIEFGDLLDTFDKNTIIQLITKIETSDNRFDSEDYVSQLEEKTNKYNLLILALQIEPFAKRILETPTTGIGNTNKQTDVNKLHQLSNDAKTKFLMKHTQEASTLVNEAYAIINKYNDWL